MGHPVKRHNPRLLTNASHSTNIAEVNVNTNEAGRHSPSSTIGAKLCQHILYAPPLQKNAMGGHSHKRDRAGFSSVQGSKKETHKLKKHAVNLITLLPAKTFAASPGRGLSRPKGR